MNLDFNSLIKLLAFLDWVLENKEDVNEFVSTTRMAFEPYYVMNRLVGFCDNTPTIIIPFQLAADLNSIVIEYGFDYSFHYLRN